MLQQAVYFETWASPWTDQAEKMDLANIVGFNIVYLSFAKPDGTYKKGSCIFDNTGLNFCQTFTVVQNAITILKKKNIKVMLSVGGGTYPYRPQEPHANYQMMIDLMTDLGCDGIDIDWEPLNQANDDYQFGPIIHGYKSRMKGLLSGTCLPAGAYGKDANNIWKGQNIKGLVSNGNELDWVNIMAYDSGSPASYDALGSFTCYRIYYKGPLFLGVELGEQAWGGWITSEDDIKREAEWVKKDGNGGIFIWAYQKDTHGSPSVSATYALVSSVFGQDKNPDGGSTPAPPVPPPAEPSVPQKRASETSCPSCGKRLKLQEL